MVFVKKLLLLFGIFAYAYAADRDVNTTQIVFTDGSGFYPNEILKKSSVITSMIEDAPNVVGGSLDFSLQDLNKTTFDDLMKIVQEADQDTTGLKRFLKGKKSFPEAGSLLKAAHFFFGEKKDVMTPIAHRFVALGARQKIVDESKSFADLHDNITKLLDENGINPDIQQLVSRPIYEKFVTIDRISVKNVKNVKNGRSKFFTGYGNIAGLGWYASGTALFDKDLNIKIERLENYEVPEDGGDGQAVCVTFPGEHLISVFYSNGDIATYNIHDKKEITRKRIESCRSFFLTSSMFSSKGEYLFFDNMNDQSLNVFDVINKKLVKKVGNATHNPCCITPNGGLLAYGSMRGVSIFDVKTGRNIDITNVSERMHYPCAFSSNGKFLIVCNSDTLRAFDVTNAKEIKSFDGTFYPVAGFIPGNSSLFFALKQVGSEGRDRREVSGALVLMSIDGQEKEFGKTIKFKSDSRAFQMVFDDTREGLRLITSAFSRNNEFASLFELGLSPLSKAAPLPAAPSQAPQGGGTSSWFSYDAWSDWLRKMNPSSDPN